MSTDDHALITEVILRYGSALDERDTEGVLSCFTEDVRLEYFDGAVTSDGIEGARSFFRFEDGMALPGLDSIVRTTHLWNVGAIDFDAYGSRATARTSCIAHLLGTSDGAGVLVTRGLRYHDELERTEVGWRIRHRRHLPDWEARVPATSPHLPETGGARVDADR